MALSRFGFIVSGPGLDPAQHTAHLRSTSFSATTVGVSTVEQACAVAVHLVADGVQLIELCGGFGPEGTACVLQATDHAVPIGSVGYGPESTAALHALLSG